MTASTSDYSALLGALTSAIEAPADLRCGLGDNPTCGVGITLIVIARALPQEIAEVQDAIDRIRLDDTDAAAIAPILFLSHHPLRRIAHMMPTLFSSPNAAFRRLPMRIASLRATFRGLSPLTTEQLSASRRAIWNGRLQRHLRSLRHRLSSVSAAALAAARAVEQRGYEHGQEPAPMPTALAGLRRDWTRLEKSLDRFCIDVEDSLRECRAHVNGLPTTFMVARILNRVRVAAATFAGDREGERLTEVARETRMAFEALASLLAEPAGPDQ